MNENVDLKKKVFGEVDTVMDADTIVASSSSCLCASLFAENLKHRGNMLVAHPVSQSFSGFFLLFIIDCFLLMILTLHQLYQQFSAIFTSACYGRGKHHVLFRGSSRQFQLISIVL